MKIAQIIQSTGVAINQLLTGKTGLLEPRRRVPHPRSVLLMLLSLGVLLALGSAASADTVTNISGAALSELQYAGDPGDAQYVAPAEPAPALAALYTADSGLAGDTPVVYVTAAFLGFPSLALDCLRASYSLYGSFTGPTGAEPYWLTYLKEPAPATGYIGVASIGGPDLKASTPIHVFYDFATDPLTTNQYWRTTLGDLASTAYGATTFGKLTVYETGVEIGRWDNGADVIPASANIQQLTVTVLELVNRIVSITNNGGGIFTICSIGTLGVQYYLVSSGDMTAPMPWTPVPGSTNTVSDTNGMWCCVVSNPAPAFYRSVAVSPAP
jgi:hypothetical protein